MIENWESHPSREANWFSPKTVKDIRYKLMRNKQIRSYPEQGRAYYWRAEEIEFNNNSIK